MQQLEQYSRRLDSAYGRDNERAFSVEQVQAAPHLIHNLLNDLTGLSTLLLAELRRGAWLNAFLLAAGMNQIAEDSLHPDPFYLGKIANNLDQFKSPFGAVAGGFVRAIGAALVRANRYLPSTRRVMRWQADVAELSRILAEAVVAPASDTRVKLLEEGKSLVTRLGRLPNGLRQEVLRLPSCFRAFDQQPADIQRVVRDFAQRWQDRDRPLVVVGIRTSGNYLAPLYAAFLKESGYQSVLVLTVRPERDLLQSELELLRDAIRRDCLILLTDDPPVTGSSIVKIARSIEERGAPKESIVLCLQLFESRDSLPPLLKEYPAVLLPWDEWAIQDQLTPTAIQSSLENFINPTFQVISVERLPLSPRKSGRSHVHALYQIRLEFKESGRQWEQRIFVRGVGLGYFGEFSMVVALPLQQFLPKIYGFYENLLFSEWLPDEKRLSSIEPGKEQAFADKVATYTAVRHRALRVERDLSISLFSEGPAWEVASTLLSEVFARGSIFARVSFVDELSRRLLRVKHASIVDGRMSLSHWFADEKGRGLLKAEFDEATFSNDIELTCFDPVFDLASLVASVELVAPAVDFKVNDLARYLRQAYEHLSVETIDDERWLLYQLVHLWDRQHTDSSEKNRAKRASSRVMQRYYSETLLNRNRSAVSLRGAQFATKQSPRATEEIASQSVAPLAGKTLATLAPHANPEGSVKSAGVTPERVPTDSELVALDLDGVLETESLGFLSTSPAGALALRALKAHGYHPVIATGRSLNELIERCDAYDLAGGVAEYGAVVYDHTSKNARVLLSDADRAALEELREVLRSIEGVFIDPDYRYAVRAYHVNFEGHRRPPNPELMAQALAKLQLEHRVRPIVGESQTDFMVNGIDKGDALRVLAGVIASETKQSPSPSAEIASSQSEAPLAGRPLLATTRAKPFALAVGDSVSDLPMFELASISAAPANADSAVRNAGVKIMKQPYQSGLSFAASLLLGHKPGNCPTCRVAHRSENTRLLLTLLSAQESGAWSMLKAAASLSIQLATKKQN